MALTYAELLRRARSVRIVAPRVAIALPPGLDFAVALHACLLRGVEAVPVDLREPEWRLAGAGQVIGREQLAGKGGGGVCRASRVTRPRGPHIRDDRRAAPGLVAALGGARERVGLRRRARALSLGALALSSAALSCGRPDGAAALGDLWHDRGPRPASRSDVTIASLVPTQLARLVDRAPPPSLRVVMLGGAPADPTLLTRARDAGWPVAPTYGLTQACSAVTVAEVGDTETSGAPLPGLSVSIAPDGEIVVDGPMSLLHTGDLGRLDDRGRLIVLGRKVDTIVSGGENVMPAEVEAALLSHPAVAEAGVFGRPDPEWGEAVSACVVLREPVPAEELRAFAASRLARFKVPKTIEAVDALPRNAAGKLLRRELG